jgi:hypothetical protein
MRPLSYSGFAPCDAASTMRHDANLSFVSGLIWLSQNDGQTRLDAGKTCRRASPKSAKPHPGANTLRPSAIPVTSKDPTFIVGAVCLRSLSPLKPIEGRKFGDRLLNHLNSITRSLEFR